MSDRHANNHISEKRVGWQANGKTGWGYGFDVAAR